MNEPAILKTIYDALIHNGVLATIDGDNKSGEIIATHRIARAMAQIHKITTGFVTQIFDTELNRWVSQCFTTGDCVYETPDGEHLDDDNPASDSYMPYDMVQPSTLKLAVAPVEITIEVEGGVVTDVSCKTHELIYTLIDNDIDEEW